MDMLNRLKARGIDMNDQEKHPSYYTLADGRGFRQFFTDECFPLLCDDLTHPEYSGVESAFEHYFRNGFKPIAPGEKTDMEKYEWWIKDAEDLYVLRNFGPIATDRIVRSGFCRIIKPVHAMVEMERNKKISAAK